MDVRKFPVYQHGWPLRPDVCPCDVHFVEYLRENDVQNRTIFHFGTGDHHIVGRQNDPDHPNHVLAITASPPEHAAYITLLLEEPWLSPHYKVLFGDIYTLSPTLLPSFDFVTLFHLHEFSPAPDGFPGTFDDAGLLEMFCRILKPDGRILFYRGSDGFERTQTTIEDAVTRGLIRFEGTFRSLLIYASGVATRPG
jgi:SAM-dependent methyltransferase